MGLLALITVPSATTTFDSVGTWSTEAFTNLLPIGLMLAGIIVGALIIKAFAKYIVRGVKTFVGGGKRRGRR